MAQNTLRRSANSKSLASGLTRVDLRHQVRAIQKQEVVLLIERVVKRAAQSTLVHVILVQKKTPARDQNTRLRHLDSYLIVRQKMEEGLLKTMGCIHSNFSSPISFGGRSNIVDERTFEESLLFLYSLLNSDLWRRGWKAIGGSSTFESLLSFTLAACNILGWHQNAKPDEIIEENPILISIISTMN